MTLYPLGVGDAFARRYFSTALALEAAGRWLLVDCPHPIRRMMAAAAAPIDVGDLDAVVLTHLHGDHVSGLEGLAFYNRFYHQRRTALICHPEVAAALWDRHLAVAMERLILPDATPLPPQTFADYFDLRPLIPGSSVTVGPFTVEGRATVHHIPTTAVRITTAEGSLSYSADTIFDSDLVEWLAAADLVVHETNHGPHTPYERLAALPADLRARMRLVQYPDAFDVEGSVIECLREGRAYAVTP